MLDSKGKGLYTCGDDRFTKFSHFIPINRTFSGEDYAKIYINEIVRLHDITLSIVSDRVTKFTLRF